MSKMRVKSYNDILSIFFALGIPLLLLIYGSRSAKTGELSREVEALERRENTLIEQNKKLVADISVLSSSARVEEIAKNELGMQKASKDEIIRVEVLQNE